MAAERPARSAPRRGAAAYGVAYMASENPISKENNTLWQHTTEHTHVTEEGGGLARRSAAGVSRRARSARISPGAERAQRSLDQTRREERKQKERKNKMKREKRKVQHPAFPRGPPPQYCPGSTPLNFAVRMGSGEPG